MKITIFDGSFKTTAFIRRLMQGLVKNGVQVSVIGFNEDNPNPVSGVNYRSLGSNQNKLSFIKTSLSLALRSRSLSKITSTLNFLAKGKRKALQNQNLDLVLHDLQPDIVHLQWPSLLPWMEPYLEKESFKVILSQRGFHTNVRPFVNKQNFDYLQKIYPQLDGLHSVSEAISKVGKKIGTPKTKIDRVVYTGLHLADFPFEVKVANHKKLQLLSVGRPHWKKDYPTAIKACAILKEKNISFHYTIVGGEGDEESLFLIHELGLENHISLTGKLPQQEVFKKMREADLFLLPSIEEGIANVAVEAMALGTPVISTNCGGMEELIKNKKEGWIIPTRDEVALAEAVEEFIALEESEVIEVIKNARKKVEFQHQESKMVRDMIDLYKAVIKD
ncbi:glycosyltransferase family 4 protein [Haloflavibacter putidus]|uniref:Glycosyltransferase family 4 protein n=1 Tax=Haloflavibacter putidus TaxID=2576776 RepID=A0A507ZJB9_9FLAO|nr:glycosyltransferase family 4 protein [Haloflavibacter putidus]TQD33822.1 glycosyltransferase family 4 protein [Haloflavibacter putidus]